MKKYVFDDDLIRTLIELQIRRQGNIRIDQKPNIQQTMDEHGRPVYKVEVEE